MYGSNTFGRRFEGRVAIVTGGSKGIGLAVAERLAWEGANLAITQSRSPEATQEAVERLQAIGSEVIALPGNVSNEEEMKTFFESVIKHYGDLHVVVHSAGISPNTDFFDQTAQEWRDVLETNLIGSFVVTQTALRVMKALSNGSKREKTDRNVVLIGSTNGVNSNDPMSAHYDSSKAGVNLLANTAAKLFGDTKVRVNAIAPGWINTSLNDTLPPDYRQAEEKRIYVGRFASTDEVADAVANAASPLATYVNGAVIMVDGGYN